MSSLREHLNDKPQVSWAIVACLLCVAAVVILMRLRGPGTNGLPAYFYDLGTEKLVARRSTTLSPDPESPDQHTYAEGTGGSRVRAIIWACTEGVQLQEGMTRDDIRAAGALLVSLERYSIDTLQRIQQQRSSGGGASDTEDRTSTVRLASGPDGTQWFKADSPRAQALLEPLDELCKGKGIYPVRP